MAKTTIRPESETPISSTSLATVDSTLAAPAAVGNYNPDAFDSGAADQQMPSFGVVNSVGPRAKKFRQNVGEFVVGDLVLGPGPIDVIALGAKKFYRESIRNGETVKFDDDTAKVWSSARDAFKDGYYVWTADTRGAKNLCDEGARVVLMVRAPDKLKEDPTFDLIGPDGNSYVAAVSTYQRGGYRDVYQRIYNRALREAKLAASKAKQDFVLETAVLSYHTAVWEMVSEEKEKGSNSWFQPVLTTNTALDPEFIAWAEKEAKKLAIRG